VVGYCSAVRRGRRRSWRCELKSREDDMKADLFQKKDPLPYSRSRCLVVRELNPKPKCIRRVPDCLRDLHA
jgi:hypothetical protein